MLDEAEARFPFDGLVEFEEPETHEKLQVDASGFRPDYLAEVQRVLRPLSPRMLSSRRRLRRPGHQHAVRPGPDRIPGQPQSPRLSRGRMNDRLTPEPIGVDRRGKQAMWQLSFLNAAFLWGTRPWSPCRWCCTW